MKRNNKTWIKQLSESYTYQVLKKSMQEAAGDPSHRWKPANQFRPPVPGWRPVPFPEQTPGDHSGFPKDRRFITPDNPKGYWKWDGGSSTATRAPAPSTTRPAPLFTPKLPTTPLGRLGLVGAAAAAGYGVGTAIDHILHGRPGVQKDQLRPTPTEHEQLPSPESLYPSPSKLIPPSGGQGSGGGGSGSGGIGG